MKSLFVLFFSFITLALQAQVGIFPLTEHSRKRDGNGAGKRTMESVLTLPFFDDFSTSTLRPDTLLWEKKGGTTLNNSIALFPPTLNVVTFDGFNAKGTPYDLNNPLFSGATDTLTSLPIDLSAVDPAAAVYLSFMWQAEGLGEEPDASNNQTDSLTLQLLAGDSIWTSVWKMSGQSVSDFKNGIINVGDAKFFWPGFRFRFVSYGNLAGPFDNWHIDYVYMDSNRFAGDTIREDLALSKTPKTFLKRYRSLPYNQFITNVEQEVDSALIYVYNLENNGLFPNPTLTITGDIAAPYIALGEVKEIKAFSKDSIPFPIDWDQLKNNLLPAEIPENDSLLLKLKYDIVSQETGGFERNDTITLPVKFGNYFAYDDGSAERAFRVDGRGSQVAYRFEVNKPDTLTAVDFYFPKQITDLTGTSFRIKVWKKFGETDSIYKALGASIIYSDSLNKFTRYRFNELDQFIIDGEFYVGYEQLSNDPIYIGYDRNTNSSNEILYKLGNSQQPIGFDKFSGSLMIRPVFGKAASPTSTNNPEVVKPYTLYPNPTPGLLTLEGGNIEAIAVFDPTGRLVYSDQLRKKDKHLLNFDIFPEGQYIIHLKKGSTTYTEKLLISK